MIDVKYLAGLFDGEGHIGIYENLTHCKHPAFRLESSIHNNHKGVLEETQKDYGGYLWLAHNKKCWRLCWQGEEAGVIIRTLYPHLIIKKEQADLALAFVDYGISNPRLRGVRLTWAEIEEKRWFMDEIKRVRV